jgi:hypothetical protein
MYLHYQYNTNISDRFATVAIFMEARAQGKILNPHPLIILDINCKYSRSSAFVVR